MALQQPLVVYPALDETVDATSTVSFEVTIRGTQCVKYVIYIYDVATNTQQYLATETLAATLYDGDTLNISVDMASLGADSYYWKILLYDTLSTYITSINYTFEASTPPTIAFTPSVPSIITLPFYEFIGAYTQAEDIGVKYFYINLYDYATTQTQITAGTAVPIQTSGQVWSSNIRYIFNGLVSGNTYQVQITGYTQGNVAFATALTSFDVSYSVPSSLLNPIATLNEDSSVLVKTGNIYAITGTPSGTMSFQADYLYTGNTGLNMATSAYVQFALDFTAPFTQHWICSPSAGFTGVLGEIKNTAGENYLYLGHDGTKFYLNINGNYFYDSLEALTTNPYILAIINDGITISFYHREVV